MSPHAELLDIFKFFPGISAASEVQPVPGGGVALAMAFDDTAHGTAARLTVEIIAERQGVQQQGALRWQCNAAQAKRFVRYLNYASLRPLGPARPPAALATTPLPVLLSHTLIGFEQEYDELAGDDATPHLGVWANVLRVIGDDGLDMRELGPRQSSPSGPCGWWCATSRRKAGLRSRRPPTCGA